MALRGLLRRKLQGRGAFKKTAAYKRAFDLEKKKIEKQRSQAKTERIQARARADARRAATPKSSRFIAGLRSAGKYAKTQLDKHDPDKFEAFVTGKKKKKK